MEKENDIILDIHLVIGSYEAYIPGMIREFAEILKPDGVERYSNNKKRYRKFRKNRNSSKFNSMSCYNTYV